MHLRPAPAFARLAVLAIAIAACGDNECATGASGDGSYTLSLDGRCFDHVTVDYRVDGAWQASGAELAWRAAPAGGYYLTVSAPAPAEALELTIPDVAAALAGAPYSLGDDLNGLVTPPPATFHATGKSGTPYTITFDWTARSVTISP